MNSRRVWVLLVFLVFGCAPKMEHVKCPGFDFGQLGVESYYFDKALYYSNGIDTIRLECSTLTYSLPTEFDRGNGVVHVCYPSFFVKYRDSTYNNSIYRSFSPPKEFSNRLNLSVGINFSDEEFALDSIDKFGVARIKVHDDLHPHNRALTEFSEVAAFEMEKYRVAQIEKKNGERWNLIKAVYETPGYNK